MTMISIIHMSSVLSGALVFPSTAFPLLSPLRCVMNFSGDALLSLGAWIRGGSKGERELVGVGSGLELLFCCEWLKAGRSLHLIRLELCCVCG